MIVLRLFWEPLALYRSRLERPAGWQSAAAAPLMAAALMLAAQMIFLHKSQAVLATAQVPALEDRLFWSITYAATVLSAFSYPALWLIGTLWLLALAVLCGRTVDPTRTLGALGLAFYSQVPYLLLMLAVVLHWQPAAMGAGDFASRAEAFSREVTADAWFSVVRVLGHASHVWLFVLFGIGYRVAVPQGRLPAAATVTLLYLLFVGAGLALAP